MEKRKNKNVIYSEGNIVHRSSLQSAELLHEINKKIFSECNGKDYDAFEQIRKNCVLIQTLVK